MTFGRGLANFTTDAEATAQNVMSRLQLLQGEWFLDTSAGVPYLENDYVTRSLTQKPTDLSYVEAVIKQTILDTDGVDSITSFSMSFDTNTRKLVISATLSTIYDVATTIQVRL
jgi:hypothetical protein